MDECKYCLGFGYVKPDPFNESFVRCPKCNPLDQKEVKTMTKEELEEELFEEDIGFKISSC